ncbi:SGNH/GDSL hydrolase family protein [Curtobacterium oceanosedimentum]|uniref:SGNH hydrolase-type esterase domain-containing protein n=1 Tax=Curtobacterium oceanosedimentum TaxID=465820 RepID=A0A147DM56_9MICO|nr:SGNH/GDSL hydrolase family protein [Curtobacterium oceanosedimentum]KTR47310.1 hypothetical protein NS359_15190 [Curtobacterium oceanosedimentum]
MADYKQIRARRDTWSSWSTANPILEPGEPTVVVDPGNPHDGEERSGNGVDRFLDLPVKLQYNAATGALPKVVSDALSKQFAGAVPLNSVSTDATIGALDMGKNAAITIAAAGDSIGMLYPATSWFEGAFKDLFANLWFERPVNLRRWDAANNVLAAPTVVQAGGRTSGGTQTGVTVFSESFNKKTATGTVAEAVGTVPETGGPWQGPSGTYVVSQPADTVGVLQVAAGVTPSLANPIFATMAQAPANPDHVTQRATRISTNSATTAEAFYWSILKTNGDGVRLHLVASSTTTATLTLEVVTNGVVRTIGTLTNALASNTQDQVPVLTVTVSGTAISATSKIGSNAAVSTSGTLTADEVTALTGWTRVGIATTELRYRDDYIVVTATVSSYNAPSVPPVLLINGCANGTTTEYQQARIPQMYPVRPDLFLIGHGMNHTDETPTVFLGKVQALVDALLAVYPDVPIGIITENPRYPAPDGAPASRPADHLARQVALRTYARSKGWFVADAFTYFTKQSDAGYSWVQAADGKHPNTAGQAAMVTTLKSAVSRISTRA